MLKYALCAFLGLTAVGCYGAPASSTDGTETYGQTTAALTAELTTAQVSQLVTTYYTAVRGLQLQPWLDCFANDAVLEDPVGLSRLEGKENIAAAYQSAIDNFSVLNMQEGDVFTPDLTNEAAIHWGATLTYQGGQQIAPFTGITTIKYKNNGKIKLLKAFWNPAVLVAARY